MIQHYDLERDFMSALLKVDRIEANRIFEENFIHEDHIENIEKLAVDTLEKIGTGWEDGSVSLSQVYMSGVICEELIDKYLPRTNTKRKDIPRMAIVVLHDYHSLGKRIVYSVLRAGGFEIIDFGQGLSVEEVIELTISNQIEILLISTLMLPSALKISAVKEGLTSAGANTKIIVGGAPFRMDKHLWKVVGAHADGKNATEIVEVIERMVHPK